MIELAVRAGVQRIVLNGSFVTDIMEPNDVDCVMLVPAEKVKDKAALRELRTGIPFINAAIVRNLKRFNEYANGIFATDRDGVPKGAVEVRL